MNECSAAQNATNSRCAKEVRTKLYVQINDWNEPANQMRWQFLEAIFRQFPAGKKSLKKTTTNKQTRLNDNKRIFCAVMNACGLFAMSKAWANCMNLQTKGLNTPTHSAAILNWTSSTLTIQVKYTRRQQQQQQHLIKPPN